MTGKNLPPSLQGPLPPNLLGDLLETLSRPSGENASFSDFLGVLLFTSLNVAPHEDLKFSNKN